LLRLRLWWRLPVRLLLRLRLRRWLPVRLLLRLGLRWRRPVRLLLRLRLRWWLSIRLRQVLRWRRHVALLRRRTVPPAMLSLMHWRRSMGCAVMLRRRRLWLMVAIRLLAVGWIARAWRRRRRSVVVRSWLRMGTHAIHLLLLLLRLLW